MNQPALRLDLLMLLTMLWMPVAHAQIEQATDTQDPEPVIEATMDVSDSQIRERIERIFAEIESLEGVQVDVREGVVTLAGSVSNEKSANMALNIAARMEGNVAVLDRLERSLDIEGNVSPLLEALQQKSRAMLRAIPLLLVAVSVFAVIALIGHLFAGYMPLWRRLAPNVFLAHLLSQAVRFAFFLAGIVIALNLIGATALMGTILGSAGVIGLAIGFAVRDSMENYISSIMLSIRQPFRPQDHVVINEHEGIVVRLTPRSTILMTLSGNHLRIPNSTVFKAVIQNYSTNPERRFDFRLGIGAGDDPIEAIQVGTRAIAELDFVLDTPKPGGIIVEVGDSSIVLMFTGWIDQAQTSFGSARSLAISSVARTLESRGFTLPEPIYRLRFDEADAKAGVSEAVDTERRQSGTRPEAASETRAAGLPAEAELDVRPDSHLSEKIDAERAESASEDLLDSSRPIE